MEEKNNLSNPSLKRLPTYLRVLKDKDKEGLKFISSTLIAEELRLNPIQVRKDLACVSNNEGKPGVGFVVKELIQDIENFLGMDIKLNAIIVGAGRLGSALLSYNNFDNNINILSAFDIDEKKCNNSFTRHVSEMKSFIKKKDISIGIIAVPKDNAKEVCDELVSYGIKAIWNFAPIVLQVPEDIVIKNEDLSASLSILLKMMEDKSKKNK